MRIVPILLTLAGFAAAQTTITLGGDTTPAIRPLLGINNGPQPSGDGTVDFTTRFQDAGVNMVRMHDYNGPMDMALIYPDQSADPSKDSSYNWTQSDVTWKRVLDGGFEPYIRIGYSNNVRPVTNQTNWAAAAVAIVRRYTDVTRWGRNAVRYVEIYNEPDSRTFGPAPTRNSARCTSPRRRA